MTRLMKRLSIIVIAFASTARAHGAAEVGDFPKQLKPWQSQIEIVLSHFSSINPSEGAWSESTAGLQTQKQKLLPTLSAGVNLNRSQSRLYDGNTELSSTGPSNDLQLNLSIRQNLFRGGADLKQLTIAERKERLTFLKHIQAQRQYVRGWLKDVAGILHQTKILSFHVEAAKQAKALNALAARKEASGLLGRRDLLDSQRELLRVEQENLNAQNTLSELIERHKLSYRFDAPQKLNREDFVIFARSVLADAKQSSVAQRDPNFYESLIPIAIAQLEKQMAQEDLLLAGYNRLSPRIDAVGQMGQNRSLNGMSTSVNRSSISNQSANSSQSWSVALTGEISLNPPVAFGAVEENRQRVATAQRSEQQTRENLGLALETTLLRLQQVRQQKSSIQRLVSITEQLQDKNQRLFEAGELSIDRLIASQQDLNRDKISLANIEFEELKLSMELSFCEFWNLAPTAGTP